MIIPPDLLTYGVVAAIVAALGLYVLPTPCRCDHCAFHIHERAEERAKQAELHHEVQHRGYGYRGAMRGPDPGSPDRWDCADINCRRNRTNRPPS